MVMIRRSHGMRLIAALVSIALVTVLATVAHLNSNTVGFAYLIVLIFISLWSGLVIGLVASLAATLCFNYFFFAPVGTFSIEEPANWFALAAFLLTSISVSRLVVAARMQAEKAERRRQEVERLATEREQLIEQRAHVDALRESESLKTSLLRAISHDLTTPLTAITIRTQALRRWSGQHPELAHDVDAIAGETSRLRRRIDNLMAMARLEAGKAKPRREPTPPADLFRAVKENLPLVFDNRPIRLSVTDDCADADVDPSLVLEVLVNLVENAHRASPDGEPIELVACPHPSDPRLVRMEVLDRGPGLPRDTSAEVSDIAQRGLGLQIAHSLTAANGGTLELLPRPGGGTVAVADFPSARLSTEVKP